MAIKINFSKLTPAPPANASNVTFQSDAANPPNLSAYVILAKSLAATANKFFTAYDAATGLFTSTQPAASDVTGLATVATSGSYADLSSKPTIPPAQVNSDWNAVSGVAQILNKPAIPADQVQSDWNAASGLGVILHKPVLAASATTDTTNASNVTTGTLPSSVIPSPSIKTVTANYAALSTDYTIRIDCTAGAVTITLPVTPKNGMVLYIKKIDASTNVVTISGGTIDGAPSRVASSQYTAYRLQYCSDDATWGIY